mmetsp:Transcript_13847/g.34089  ORF Transcript_13847/g.34089 Transcript_13847/m.34089 type:complete len:169 (+) Transcript_13847:331-837(+)
MAQQQPRQVWDEACRWRQGAGRVEGRRQLRVCLEAVGAVAAPTRRTAAGTGAVMHTKQEPRMSTGMVAMARRSSRQQTTQPSTVPAEEVTSCPLQLGCLTEGGAAGAPPAKVSRHVAHKTGSEGRARGEKGAVTRAAGGTAVGAGSGMEAQMGMHCEVAVTHKTQNQC